MKSASDQVVSSGETFRAFFGGFLGGLFLALGDFGATWLYASLWEDRLWLLLRLIGTAAPLGGVLAVLLAAVIRKAGDRFAPAALTATLLPGTLWVSHLLFTGGKMRTLPARQAWVVVCALLLSAAVFALIRFGLRWYRDAVARGPKSVRNRTLVAIGAAFVVTKIDQMVLPNLYGYLHACLAFAAWVCATVAARFILDAKNGSATRGGQRIALVGSVACLLLLVLNVATLGAHPNVRVFLFDPRASVSRSLMTAIEPLRAAFAREDRERLASLAAARRRHRPASHRSVTGPHLEDAHVLLITIDALRPDRLGLYGYSRNVSPELDSLARKSVVFERAYAQAPHSSYSLTSLMTAEYIHETVELGGALPDRTWAHELADAGYQTAAYFTLGIFHTEGERLTRYQSDAFGFELHDHADYNARQRTDHLLEEIDRIAASGEQNAFLWAHYFDVHAPYEDTTLGTSDTDRYDSEIQLTDREIGRLLRGVEAKLKKPVIVIVTADHGEEFRDHGGVYHGSTLYEEQIRVPLIVHVPDVSPRRVPRPVELVDLAPTTLGILGIEPAPTMRGDDIRPLLVDDSFDPGPAHAAVTTKRMTVVYPHKLIADLRFGLFELYDLSEDPRERRNLAGTQSQRVEELRGELYGWLDSLSRAPRSEAPADPHRLALDQGRLGDRRAVESLCAILLDERADESNRREAARILGRLADPRAIPSLFSALETNVFDVQAEAAIALGRMYDSRAHRYLRPLVDAEDPDIRTRASVSLARLRDPAAVPGLIEALWVAPVRYEREEAVRWLGRLRDPRGTEPLLSLLPEFRIRYLVVVALGEIGDPRAFEPLAEMLAWEEHSNIRDNVVRGLGQLGDKRAIPYLIEVARNEPELRNTSESLVRLGAIESGAIGGTDAHRNIRGARGVGRCELGPLYDDWSYVTRTFCESSGSHVTLDLAVPAALRNQDATLALAVRRNGSGPAQLTTTIGSSALPAQTIDERWVELHLPIAGSMLRNDHVLLTLRLGRDDAKMQIDHALLIPHPTSLAAR